VIAEACFVKYWRASHLGAWVNNTSGERRKDKNARVRGGGKGISAGPGVRPKTAYDDY
jgi:hypothetical protein